MPIIEMSGSVYFLESGHKGRASGYGKVSTGQFDLSDMGALIGMTFYSIIVMDAYAQAGLTLEAVETELETFHELPKFYRKRACAASVQCR